VTLSNTGYIKSQPLADYQAQRRGGRGKSATTLKEEDFVEKLAIASTHAMMLCFSSTGKVYWKKVYEFPLASRQSRGRPIVNLLPLEEGESITAMLAVREFDADHFVFMATANGTVKKTPLEAFSRPRANGIWAINLAEDDALIGVALTDGQKEIMLFSDSGKAVRFTEDNVRAMGRTATGVRGIRLQDQQKVISLISTSGGEEGDILTATENGYGKRTKLDEYRLVNRGAQGVMSIQTTERNGRVIGAALVHENDEVMLITNGGTMVRTRAAEISLIGRNTQGVRLIRLSEGEQLVSVKRIVDLDDDDDEVDVDQPTPEGDTEN